MSRLGSSVPPSNSVESSQIQDGSIAGADLALGSVSGSTIAAGALVHEIAYNGTLIGTRKQVNLIPGTNTTLTVQDNAAADRVDVTITAGSSNTVDRKLATFSLMYSTAASNPNPVGVGWSASSPAATPSTISPGTALILSDGLGYWHQPTNGGVAGDACGWKNPFSVTALQQKPIMQVRFGTNTPGAGSNGGDTSSGIMWFGLFSGIPIGLTNLATAGVKGFGFGFRHPGSLNLEAVVCDGTTEVRVDTGRRLAITSGSAYNLKVDASNFLSGISFSINDVQVANIYSGLPLYTLPLTGYTTFYNINAATKRISLSKYQLEHV